MRWLLIFVVLGLNAQAQQNYFNSTYDYIGRYNVDHAIFQLPDSGYLAGGWNGFASPLILYSSFYSYDKNGVSGIVKSYGSPPGVEGINHIIRNSQGDLFASGGYRPTNIYGNQITLMKINNQGDTLWRKFYGVDSLNENGWKIIDNGSHFFICSEAYDYPNGDTEKMVLIKTDYSGNQIFYKSYQPDLGCHYVAHSLVKLSNGDIVMGGYRYQFLNNNTSALDFCLIKTDSAGNFKWQKYFPTQGWDEIQEMEVTDSDKIILFGYKCMPGYFGNGFTKLWMGIADTAGTFLMQKTFLADTAFDVECNSLIKNSDGDFVLAGSYRKQSSGNTINPFILKINEQGDSLWMRFYHKNPQYPADIFYDIKQTFDGGYIVSGVTYEPTGFEDSWLLKVDCLGFDSPDSSICFITETITDTICEGSAYNFYGNNLTTSGNYVDTIVVYCYCDTIVTLQLTVLPTSDSLITQSICAGEIFNFNGMNLSLAGNYADTLTNILGCDSIIELQLSVLPISNFSLADSICEGDVFDFNGMNLTIAGNYSDTLTNILGCDSVVNLSLTVLNSSSASLTKTICEGDVFNFNGTNLSITGIYSDTINAMNGCDSIITLNLIVEIINAGIQQSNDTLITTGNGTIQWFDCNTQQIISGETANVFITTSSGNYAAIISTGLCSDTTVCIFYDGINNGVSNGNSFLVYPNPFNDVIRIEIKMPCSNCRIEVMNILGEKIISQKVMANDTLINTEQIPSGIYFIKIVSDTWSSVKKVVKE